MRYIIAVLLLMIPASLAGATFGNITLSAEENSFQAERARIVHESGLISISQAELDDQTDYSVSVAVSPLEDGNRIINVSDLAFSATLPDDDTTFSASVPFSIRYDGNGALLNPSLSASHIFDWGRKDDRLKELQTASSRLSVEREYSSSLLSLRSSVISAIASLLENERSLMEGEENLRDAERELSNALQLGDITENSISYLEAQFTIKRAQDSVRILETEKEELVKRFSNLTGLDWDGVSDIPVPQFAPILSIESSSSLEEADLYASIAEEEFLLEESRQNPQRLTIGGEVNGSKYIGAGLGRAGILEEDRIGASVALGWESREWSLGLSGGGTWNQDFSFTPSVRVSGSWHSNSSSESDSLTLRTLQNEALLRRGEYYDLRRSFEEESDNLWGRMLSWQRSYSEMKAEVEYRQALRGIISERLERGLANEEELHDAEVELDLLMIDRDILLLDGLALENEMNIHIL